MKDQTSTQYQWLAGQAEFALGSYETAVKYLLAVEALHPRAVELLEVCYRELGDYKKAYEYACKGRK